MIGLLISKIKSQKLKYVLLILVSTLSMGIIFLCILLYHILYGLLIEKRIGTVDTERFEVTAPAFSNTKLDPSLLTQLQSSSAQGIRRITVPSSFKVHFFGNSLENDIFVFAVEDSLFSGEKEGIGISRSLLDIYNSQIGSNGGEGFPKIDPKLISAFDVDIYFGKSTIFGNKDVVTYSSKISHIDTAYPLFGLTISKSKARELLSEDKLELIKIIGKSNDIESLRKQYPSIQFTTDADQLAKIRQQLLSVQSILAVFCGIIIVFAYMVILQALISQKLDSRKYMFLLRIHGYGRLIPLVLLCEYIFISLISSLLLWGVYRLLTRQLPTINVFLENIFLWGYRISLPSFWSILNVCGRYTLILICSGLIINSNLYRSRFENKNYYY